VAVAHSILVIAYHLLQRQEPYRDLGSQLLRPTATRGTTSKRLVKRLEKLGYQVLLQPQVSTRSLTVGLFSSQ